MWYVNKPAHFCNLLDYSFRYDCFLLGLQSTGKFGPFLCIYIENSYLYIIMCIAKTRNSLVSIYSLSYSLMIPPHHCSAWLLLFSRCYKHKKEEKKRIMPCLHQQLYVLLVLLLSVTPFMLFICPLII